MYENYFGLVDLPFRVAPEPHYLYSNPAYRRSFCELRDAIKARSGLIVITGEIGSGKTTLLTMFLHNSTAAGLETALVINPSLTFPNLLRHTLLDLGLQPDCSDDSSLVAQLKEYAAQQSRSGRNVALFIDEAQILDNQALDQLRLLIASEIGANSLVQVVLLGQPELEQKLDRPELRLLKERIRLHLRLAPLRDDEVPYYIDYRLARAGGRGDRLFDAAAVDRIILYSAGIPRLVNIICDNALLTTYALSKKTVSAEIIDEVADDLQLGGRAQVDEPRRGSEAYAGRGSFPAPPPGFQPATLLATDTLGGRHANLAAAGLALGLLFAVALLVNGSSGLYRSSNFMARVQSQAEEAVEEADGNGSAADNWRNRDWGKTSIEVERASMREEERTSRSANGAGVSSGTSEAGAGMMAIATEPPQHGRTYAGEPRNSERQTANTDDRYAAEGLLKRPAITEAPQRATAPRYWPHDKTPGAGHPRGQRPNSEQRFFQGKFEVTADSLVFDQPQRQSALLKTLRPGVQVRVEKKVGSFLIVRSLDESGVQGYVHLEDAFFRRIGE